MKNNKVKNKAQGSEVWDTLKTLLISFMFFWLLSTYVVRPVQVQGSSMYPTLQTDAIGLSNILGVHLHGIERFDIAIIRMDTSAGYLVKRVVGLPGETVQYRDGKLYINGVETAEDFLDQEFISTQESPFSEDTKEYKLAEDEYFCVGDNRPVSRDSRYYGPFKESQISSKGVLILYPFNEFGVKSW